MRLVRSLSGPTSWFAALFLAGCAGGMAPGVSGLHASSPQGARGSSPAFAMPALVTLDTQNGSLEYWPIHHGGSRQFKPLSASLGVYNGYGLVANGDVVAVANYSPAEVVTYDLKTKMRTVLPDPYGAPVDIAIDKNAALYALNVANVAIFEPGSSQPAELTCSYMTEGEAIAVDNEGDVFVDGYGPHGFTGVIEYPAGTSSCAKLHLRAQEGYVAGVGVDPKTDDLIVVDDPDLCAGGIEGRMTVYRKPYTPRTSFRRLLSATYCSGTFRLDASSTHIFYSDATVSDGFPLIDEARYPSGKYEGQYSDGYYSGGNFGGFTTIPNRLPN